VRFGTKFQAYNVLYIFLEQVLTSVRWQHPPCWFIYFFNISILDIPTKSPPPPPAPHGLDWEGGWDEGGWDGGGGGESLFICLVRKKTQESTFTESSKEIRRTFNLVLLQTKSSKCQDAFNPFHDSSRR
jgi:hypothetical protein